MKREDEIIIQHKRMLLVNSRFLKVLRLWLAESREVVAPEKSMPRVDRSGNIGCWKTCSLLLFYVKVLWLSSLKRDRVAAEGWVDGSKECGEARPSIKASAVSYARRASKPWLVVLTNFLLLSISYSTRLELERWSSVGFRIL